MSAAPTTTAKAGDVIFTGGQKIKITEAPHWNDFHKRWFAAGYRFIKAKGGFSTVHLVHSFEHFEVVS